MTSFASSFGRNRIHPSLIVVAVGVVVLFHTWLLAQSKPLPALDAPFSSSDYRAVLHAHVDDRGTVDYSRLKADMGKLDAFVASLAVGNPAIFEKWPEKDKIAFWSNAYNALTLEAIVDHYPIRATGLKSLLYPENSIRQIPGVWDKLKFGILGRELTLDAIEHSILREKFEEQRIHLALVCAARGCPQLRNEPYDGAKLDEQLDDQARRFFADPAKFRLDRDKATVFLSPIFKWYGQDFVKRYGNTANFPGKT